MQHADLTAFGTRDIDNSRGPSRRVESRKGRQGGEKGDGEAAHHLQLSG
jgi:hypothetical protein